MKLIKFLVIFMFSVIFLYPYSSDSLTREELKSKLYIVEGTGKYKGYKELKGFGDDRPYKVYFEGGKEGNIVSFHSEIEEKKPKNLNEIITWKYKGNIYKNTRLECYNFFNDYTRLDSIIHTSVDDDWLEATFGQVYDDWFNSMSYSDEASRLVDIYFSEIKTETSNFYNEPIVIKENPWISEKELNNMDLLFSDFIYDGSPYPYLATSGISSKKLYYFPSFKRNFLGEKEIDGILLKIDENGIVYFDRKTLEKLHIIESEEEKNIYNKMNYLEKQEYTKKREEYKQNLIENTNQQLKKKKEIENNNFETNWISIDELNYGKYEIGFKYWNVESGIGFCKKNNLNYGELIYPVPNYNLNNLIENKETKIDGIIMIKKNGKVFFNLNSLKENKIFIENSSKGKEEISNLEETTKKEEIATDTSSKDKLKKASKFIKNLF